MKWIFVGLVFLALIATHTSLWLALVLMIWLLLIKVDDRAQLSDGGRSQLALHRIDRELRTVFEREQRPG